MQTTTIQLHYPLEFIVEYVEKWAEQVKKDGSNSEAEIAMAADMLVLAKVASSVMVQQKEKGDNGNNQSAVS